MKVLKFYFRIGVNEPKNFFDMSYMTELVPGYQNFFTVKATKTIASSDIKDTLTPLERSCRFPDEMPMNMTLFNSYSKAACKFECMISIM